MKASILTPECMAQLLRRRPADAHKGTMGHALLYAGSKGIAGCAVLAAEACLRAGAGKLTVATSDENRIVLQTCVPEAIISNGLPLELAPYQSVGAGPGIGRGCHGLLQRLLAEGHSPKVLDADALRILAEEPDLFGDLGTDVILTPHAGEMRCMMDGLGMDKKRSLQDGAAEIVRGTYAVVVLKGHPTHLYAMDDESVTASICPRGNAGMATAGSGDVLTGVITGLLAQGYCIHHAAELGVWLHATAGDLAAEELGQECLLARDIIRHLPGAFRELYEY